MIANGLDVRYVTCVDAEADCGLFLVFNEASFYQVVIRHWYEPMADKNPISATIA